MFSGLPGQKVNGNTGAAVGPIETMVPGLPGQKVNGNSTPAVGPIETMVPGFPGQKVNGYSTPGSPSMDKSPDISVFVFKCAVS